MRFAVALLALLAACAPATQQRPATPIPDPSMPQFEVMEDATPPPAPLASPIVVSLDLPVATAMDRTVAAFAAEGLRVERVDRDARRVRSAGVLAEALPAEGTPPTTLQAEHFYHATVEPGEPGSRVVLSVSSRTYRRSATGTQTTPEAEMQECQRTNGADAEAAFRRCEQQMGRVKARLDNLARRVHTVSR